MTHHTGFMQRRLTVEDEDVAVAKVPVHLLVDRRGGSVETLSLCGTVRTILRSQQLVGDRCALLEGEFVLPKSSVWKTSQ